MTSLHVAISGHQYRHGVDNDDPPANSTLMDASIPCIDIHDIHWSRFEAEENGKSPAENNPLT